MEAQEAQNKHTDSSTGELRTIPILGSVLITLRAVQRPIWGFYVLYIDLMIFSKKWDLPLESDSGYTPEGMTILLLNFLVLGFLFGERTLKNVVPVLIPLLDVLYGRIKKG